MRANEPVSGRLILMMFIAVGALWTASFTDSDFVAGLLIFGVMFPLLLYVLYRLLPMLKRSPTTPKAGELYAELQSVGAMSGAQFEVFMAKIYRAVGCSATVLGGSGDQGVDLIVETSDSRVAVQCKNYAKPVGNKPVQEVYAGARHHGCTDAWVVAPNGYTKGAHQLAESVGVQLYDAGSIREWIQMADEMAKEEAEPATDEPRDSSKPWWRRMLGS